jgi:hypothetical protein
MDYRKLTKQEINSLKSHGCFCENWENITVRDGFSTDRIRNVTFSGKIQLGFFSEHIKTEYGTVKPCGLYDSDIQDCEISDNVRISNVENLANYKIESCVIVENVFQLVVCGKTTFGNGVELEILNEGGGRELQIFDKLSSQLAYLLVIYRHNMDFINKLNESIKKYVETKRATKGLIQQDARIENCQKIINVAVGEKATIASALHLENGTIISNQNDPVFIGEGVIAKSFIIQSGSKVDGAAILHSSFVGQGVQIGKQFSAENSAFFANSEGFHGEACSVFAGPYTVTHHKSTLLIAGLFSFYNAGSGSNQSNHMYKLGPVHQGILERGAKTGSFSYLLWPSRIGAFSAVIGKHYTNFDTSNLPFSYILESNGKSLLMPAMNLFTVGTKRDSDKWPKRDQRRDSEKHDLLNFELFNPYVIGKIKHGIDVLKYLDTKDSNDFVDYNGIVIIKTKIKTASNNYQAAINIYIGNEIIKQIENLSEKTSFTDFRNLLSKKENAGEGSWVDLSGMFAPQKTIECLMKSIQNGEIDTIEKIKKEMKSIHRNYHAFSWNYCVGLIEEKLDKKIASASTEEIVQLLIDWKNSYLRYNDLVLQDAEKEFSSKSRIGYGLDGNEETNEKDFEAVRGSLENNKFVVQIKEESKAIQTKADKLILLLENIK